MAVEHWHLANIDWLGDLAPEELARLRENAVARTYGANATIFQPELHPARVFILETGLVRLHRLSHQGDEFTLGYVHPGEVFGELAAFVDRPRESFATAVEPSTVLDVSCEAFVRAVRSSPSAGYAVTTQIGGRLKLIESRAEDLVFRTSLQRVAHMLLQLADEFGEPIEDRVSISIPLTHAELATLVGASRPTVSIVLGQLEDGDLVSRERRQWVILDKPGLEKIVQGTGLEAQP